MGNGYACLYLDEYPDNLLFDVLGEEVPRPKDYKGSVEYVLHTALTAREADAVHYRYGYGLTLDDVGARLGGVTRERARQIIAKALRKLRYPSRANILRDGLAAAEEDKRNAAVEAANVKIKASLEKALSENGVEDPVKGHVLASFETDIAVLTAPLEALDLSNRSYNILKRAGIDTLGDIIEHTEQDLMRLRNCGPKSLFEIEVKAAQYGYRLQKT